MIGFKSGVIIGLGVGYVLGARAGRERYLQIMEAWTNIRGDERVGAVVDKAAGIMAAPSEQVREMIGDGLRSVSDAVDRPPTQSIRIPRSTPTHRHRDL